jgi:hypothetical protein
LEEEEKERVWLAEEPIQPEDPELGEEELKKKEEDAAAKAQTETEDALVLARRPGMKLFVYGISILKTEVSSIHYLESKCSVCS